MKRGDAVALWDWLNRGRAWGIAELSWDRFSHRSSGASRTPDTPGAGGTKKDVKVKTLLFTGEVSASFAEEFICPNRDQPRFTAPMKAIWIPLTKHFLIENQ